MGLKSKMEGNDGRGGIEDDVEYKYENMSSSEVLEKLEEVGKMLLHVDVSFELLSVCGHMT